jgi:sugar lactone lactonase YvrE
MLDRIVCGIFFLGVVSNSIPDVLAADVRTIAGTGKKERTGDGGPALSAGVAEPYGLVVGPDGALYVCEISGHVVRRIDLKTGSISTVVGTGETGNDGDGGPATKARIDQPYEIRFDADGNLYFVDMTQGVVRRVDAKTHVITTVAGNGNPGFSGDGGAANQAQFKQPHSICLDNAGHLYICDIGNHRIRVVDLASGTIDTFAGTGEKQPTPDGAPIDGTPLNGPRALDFDGDHSLYLALREGNSVYRIDLETRTLHHLGGTGEKGYTGDGGDARRAKLSGPKGIALGPGGDVYLVTPRATPSASSGRRRESLKQSSATAKRGTVPTAIPCAAGSLDLTGSLSTRPGRRTLATARTIA